jgi:hypothetical protein
MMLTTRLRGLRSALTANRARHCPGGVARRFRPRLEGLEDRTVPAPLVRPDVPTRAQVSHAYGQLPLSFEANQGQTDAQVNFLSRGAGYSLFLTPGGAVLDLGGGSGTDTVVAMRLLGANPAAQPVGLNRQAGVSNYLIGNDSTQWHTGVAHYGRVEYRNVYAGIDLAYYGNQRQLEYDFVVAPGADPGAIRLSFDGARGMELDGGGDLVLHTAAGDLVEHAPVLYQDAGGVRQAVAGRYVLVGDGRVGFRVGPYDHTRPMTIDPVLSYSTYLGGSGNDEGYGIAVDGAGNAYLTGYTVATNFPTKNPRQPANGGLRDAFVTKLNATGSGLVYSTYLGGSGNDVGQGIAVDGAGNAYVTGSTGSANFPVANAYQTGLGGTSDAFVAKLNTGGSALLYSTYLGGSSGEEGRGLAVDGAGNAYVAGWTASAGDFPHTPGAFQTAGHGTDAFAAKLATTAAGPASLAYSTYLGGTDYDKAFGIAVDNAGSAYVTGSTQSADFPFGALPSLQPGHGGGQYDAFVTKVNAAGSALDYSTYLGGLGTDIGNAIAVDTATGEAYVLGSTTSANFPVMNAYQSGYAGGGDAFVARLSATGSSLVYSTYLGGGGWDGGDYLNPDAGIAVDAAGNAYVTSFTTSTNFPTKDPLAGQGAYHGTGSHTDAFVAKLATNQGAAASLAFATYLGGGDDEEAYGIAVDATGSAYVVGETQSNDFPVTKGAVQGHKSGGIHVTEAFVARIGGIPAAAPASAPVSRLTPAGPQALAASPGAGGGPSDIGANRLFAVTVTVPDAYGNVATGSTGTFRVSRSDSTVTAPADYTYMAAEAGTHASTGLEPRNKGDQTITVLDPVPTWLTQSLTIHVT